MKSSLAVLLCLLPAALQAQGVRVTGLTTARYIEMKPVTTQDRVHAVPLTQDLDVNVWGFGTGIRFYAQLRARESAGDADAVWPQANDNFDVLSAFGELDRTRVRLRAGRQWKTSSLGFYNYDGASVLFRASRSLRAELFGGWSLVAGEHDDYRSAVTTALEPYRPNQKRNIVGGEVQLRINPARFSALYQREITTDRKRLYSERFAANANVLLDAVSIDASVQNDLLTKVTNQARVRLTAGLMPQLTGSIEARRYRPYFDLWTIWGMFNPIGFREALADLRWVSPQRRTSLHILGGARSYDDDDGGVEFDRLKSSGWRAGADATWSNETVLLAAGYRADIGFGASRSQGDVSARLQIGEGSYWSLSATAFQSANELQVREGTVFGIGTDVTIKVTDDFSIGWNASLYRHDNAAPADEIDWNQMRGGLWLQWSVGSRTSSTRALARVP